MWILEVYISTELVFISKLFSGQNGKFYVCECVFLFKMKYIEFKLILPIQIENYKGNFFPLTSFFPRITFPQGHQ